MRTFFEMNGHLWLEGQKEPLIELNEKTFSSEQLMKNARKAKIDDEEITKIVSFAKENKGRNTPKEIIEILRNPDLFNLITEQECSKKIVGEKDTIKTIFLCACGSWVENSNLASFNLSVNDESGIGKDYITKNTLEIFPKEKYIKRTRISEKVFTYWHNPEFDKNWTWDGKIFYNEDVSSNVLNSDVFKVMASSGSNATIIKDQKAIDIEIKGKPVLIITFASSNPNKENLRRFNLLDCDSTINQTKEIMKRQAKKAKEGKTIEYNEDIKEALKSLKRIKVKISFSEGLLDFFPSDHLIMRTHFDRFLDYIKASCALHQFQREIDEDGYYLAEGQDYNIARIALLKTASNPSMIPLTKDQRKILDVFKKLNSSKVVKSNYSVSDLEPKITWISDRMLRYHLDSLTTFGFLGKDKEKDEEEDKPKSKKPVMVYQLKDSVEINIPNWEEIEEKCRNLSNDSSLTNVSNVSNVSNDGTNETNETNARTTSAIKPDIEEKICKKK